MNYFLSPIIMFPELRKMCLFFLILPPIFEKLKDMVDFDSSLDL